MFTSSNSGLDWITANNGFAEFEQQVILSVGTRIFCGTATNGIYISDDDGQTWTISSTGLSSSSIYSMTAKGGLIFAGSLRNGVKIKLTQNQGDPWDLSFDGAG